MSELHSKKELLARFQDGCNQSGFRNIDNYLDEAVYGPFRALVIIDEVRPELNRVIEKINADISVLELKTYQTTSGKRLYQFDTLYDEYDDEPVQKMSNNKDSKEQRFARRKRRAESDTIVVPAQEDGFKRVFIDQNCWYAIRIGAAMKDRIKFIAAYQVAPISAVTHIAEIDEIKPYKDSGKYIVKFKDKALPIGPIKLKEPRNSPQSPVYVKRGALLKAEWVEDALK
jgi:hypothetical protein